MALSLTTSILSTLINNKPPSIAISYTQSGGVVGTSGSYTTVTFTSASASTTTSGTFRITAGNKTVYYLCVGGGGYQ